jgi:hypothetical protein
MKVTTLELELRHWPYALEVHPSKNGLLLRPRRKARAGWAKGFRVPRPQADDLRSVRSLSNKFDAEGWQW